MKVGTLAYATEQGLGILAKSFYDAGVVTDVMVVKHNSRPTREDWYPTSLWTPIRPFQTQLARSFIRELDVFLIFETPFDWSLINYARQHNVRTVLMPMYECTPAQLPARPDRFICPSLLDLRYFPDPSNSQFIPVPVQVEWRQRERAEVFVHNAGHGGLRGRNGTRELIEAMQYVRSPLKLIIRTQEPIHTNAHDPRIEYRVGTVPYGELWDEGDVFVFPEKFNGLSLPLQEARAAGMLVMATDRFPMNTWLPNDPLIPVQSHVRSRIGGCVEFDEAVVDPKEIARLMDTWYGRDISYHSLTGRSWAQNHSWESLKPRYMEALS